MSDLIFWPTILDYFCGEDSCLHTSHTDTHTQTISKSHPCSYIHKHTCITNKHALLLSPPSSISLLLLNLFVYNSLSFPFFSFLPFDLCLCLYFSIPINYSFLEEKICCNIVDVGKCRKHRKM